MRLPFIQVDMDFLATSAGDLSELLRTSEAEAGWSMVRLWGWALTKAATPEALGLLVGSDMQRLAERAAGWKGEPGAFLEALCNPAVGLAERETEHRIRLVGMERYATTYRKMEADRARKSKRTPPDVARSSTGIPSEVAGKTQTQTQTQIEEEKKPAPVAPAPDALVVVAPTPKRPRKEASGPAAELWRALESKFHTVTGQPYVTGNGTVDGATVSWFLNSSKATPAEVVARWGRLLEWAKGGYPTVTGFVVLRSNWNAPQVLGIVTSKPRGNGGYIDPNKFTGEGVVEDAF